MRPRHLRPAIVGGAVVLLASVLSACNAPIAPDTNDPSGSSPSSSPSPAKPSPSPTTTIEPLIVVASVDTDGKHLTASGYVQGLVEDGGTCTFVFSRQDSTDVTVERDAVADRQTTSCGTVRPELSQFARGTWSVVLEYAIDGRQYHSTARTVEVP